MPNARRSRRGKLRNQISGLIAEYPTAAAPIYLYPILKSGKPFSGVYLRHGDRPHAEVLSAWRGLWIEVPCPRGSYTVGEPERLRINT